MTGLGDDFTSPIEGGAIPDRADDADFAVTFPVVALIASAGGLDALSRVLGPLPAELPAAVLVVLHQDPANPGQRLAAILARRTKLSLQVAADDDVLRPGLVLVIPPGRHLLITSQSRIGLIEAGPLPPSRPSADLLLATLAVTCGPRALAVVLTGMGHDGQAGVRAIAHCGGTVIAQDQATSRFFSMPSAAIATRQVSQVLALDDIATAIIAHTAAAP
ncbi:chemotaxis protein CheB [Planobispora rosea]|uniref:protein-glutamate methylesterase n=1 Tax=Planobispora rosea TaxID=35762 RepID=A0A8J3S0N7_PLARO|nr:chemotaxis protein CheB [Planobispora rosea]GGS70822.1 chemotaxis protein CheB [Planobispora rosea]GIH85387.1 chemotaxis protein CheB [Planobispora rosea]